MSLPSWFRRLFNAPQRSRRRPSRKLILEPLEDRTVLSLDFGLAFGVGGSGLVDAGKSIAVDGDGNSYVQGSFSGTMDADPSPGEALLTSAGGNDYFVAKYDPAGGLVWAVRMGGPESDSSVGDDLAIDGSGNIYVTGTFRGTADFGSFNLTSQGTSDAFLAKLDVGGRFAWALRLGTGNDVAGNDEAGAGLAIDSSGNVYTTGWFLPGSIFVSKHDPSGSQIWLKTVGGTGTGGGQGYAIALDAAGNAHMTGRYSGTVDFDPGSGTYKLSSVNTREFSGYSDAFVWKLDVAGNFVWAGSMGGAKHEAGNGVAVDGSGNVFVVGEFESASNDFDPSKSKLTLANAGGYDVFVVKFDASRNLLWGRSMGGPSEDVGNAIAIDGSGQVFTAGYLYETADFNPGSGTNTLTSAGSRDVYVSQLDAAGNYVWAGRMGGAFQDAADDMALDGAGNVHLTGYFKGQADFDPGAGEYILTSTPDTNGNPTVDAFVAKLVPLDALQAADGAARHAAGRASLSALQITPLLTEALARWQAAGVDTSAFAGIDIRIADLGGTTLGLASGNTIWLDDNAAGWGWFVDLTPGDDSEFTTPGNQGEQKRIDLLTLLAHEVGHLLGQEHAAGGVMIDTLATGIRRMPGSTEVNDWSAFLDVLVSEPMSKRRR